MYFVLFWGRLMSVIISVKTLCEMQHLCISVRIHFDWQVNVTSHNKHDKRCFLSFCCWKNYDMFAISKRKLNKLSNDTKPLTKIELILLKIWEKVPLSFSYAKCAIKMIHTKTSCFSRSTRWHHTHIFHSIILGGNHTVAAFTVLHCVTIIFVSISLQWMTISHYTGCPKKKCTQAF